MALKVEKIARRTNIFVKGHGYFVSGQEKELDKLIPDEEKRALAQRKRIQVSESKPESKKAKSDGAEASGDDNS
jgi:hypothetical protein